MGCSSQNPVHKYKEKEQEFSMPFMQVSEYSHICKGAIAAIIPIAE